MNKRVVMLWAVTAVLLFGPALAAGPTTIDKVQDKVVKTSDTGDLTIAIGGGIKSSSTTAPLITIDSSNAVTNNGVLTLQNGTSAVAIDIDATKNSTGSLDNDGTIDLSGSGTSKIGVHLDSLSTLTGSFTGAITLDSLSVVKITGDQSKGLLFDEGTVLNGDVTVGGTMSMTGSTTGSTTATALELAEFDGTIKGDVTFDGTETAVGSGASGVTLMGTIQACDTSACTEIGTFKNTATISVTGITKKAAQGVNPESGSALTIENGISGGIVNDGPSFAGDTTTAAVISANGASSPTILITVPTTATAPLIIGPDSLDANAPGDSFINRGSITAIPVDSANSAVSSSHAIVMNGQTSAPVELTGEFFSSGLIEASITTPSPAPVATAVATALEIQNNVYMPNGIEVSGQSAGVFTGAGAIEAIASGPAGALQAQAILISGTTGTTVSQITIDAGATVSASAATTDLNGKNITLLKSVAIADESNSLHVLNNAGTISATTTTGFTNGFVGTAVAVDVSADESIGLDFTNSGTVIGQVKFGNGNNIYTIASGTADSIATQTGEVDFGGGDDQLNVGQFSNVAGIITSQGSLAVSVAQNGILSVQNVGQTLAVSSLTVAGANGAKTGTLNITVSQGTTTNAPVIQSTGPVTFGLGADLGIKYGSFIPVGGTFTLIQAPNAANLMIDPSDIARYNTSVSGAQPFLFQTANIALSPDGSALQLTVTTKTSAQLGLTGYAAKMYTIVNSALINDDPLGAAMIAGINSSKQAQTAYDAFAPNVAGGERALAISLTDQATGVVDARLRQLRLFSKEPGDLTLWGNEFGEYLSTKPQVSTSDGATTSLSGYKDHGFGFSMGVDSGSAEDGWLGGAFTFYAGDIQENGDRISRLNSLWYLLTGYSEWHGRGLFFESTVNVGYVDFKGKRFINLTIPGNPATPSTPATLATTFSREADSNRAGLVGSLGATMGAEFNYGSTKILPQISLDAMSFREEGYTEANGGMGFNLKVNPYYANSMRVFLGSEAREDIDFGDFFLQPSARVGYRFDFLNNAATVHAAFADINPNQAGNQPGTFFTIKGPDPGQGNVVAGAALNATTEAWTFGLNYDFVRGDNNATEQVGTISLLGRI